MINIDLEAVVKPVVTGVLIVGGVIVVRKVVNKMRADQAYKEMGNNACVRLAERFRTALDPYSIFGLGTDEAALFATAGEVKDWECVRKAYAKLSGGGQLFADIRRDLTVEQYTRFERIVAAGGNAYVDPGGSGQDVGNSFPAGTPLITTAPVAARFRPEQKNGVILGTIPANTWVGYSTGILKSDRIFDNFLVTTKAEFFQLIYVTLKDSTVKYYFWANIDLLRKWTEATDKGQSKALTGEVWSAIRNRQGEVTRN